MRVYNKSPNNIIRRKAREQVHEMAGTMREDYRRVTALASSGIPESASHVTSYR